MAKKSKVPWVLLILGVLMMVGGCGAAVASIWSGVQPSPSWTTPGSHEVQLDAGDWNLYERVGTVPNSSQSGSSDSSPPSERLVQADSVTVTGPSGAVPTVCVSCGAFSETLTLGNTRYLGIVRFTAASAGTYTVTVESPGATVMVAPPVAATVGGVFRWIGVAIVGAFVLGGGLIWLVVRAVGGNRDPGRAGQASSGPPGSPNRGWYPDPTQPGQLRWWDGATWTDHTQQRKT